MDLVQVEPGSVQARKNRAEVSKKHWPAAAGSPEQPDSVRTLWAGLTAVAAGMLDQLVVQNPLLAAVAGRRDPVELGGIGAAVAGKLEALAVADNPVLAADSLAVAADNPVVAADSLVVAADSPAAAVLDILVAEADTLAVVAADIPAVVAVAAGIPAAVTLVLAELVLRALHVAGAARFPLHVQVLLWR